MGVMAEGSTSWNVIRIVTDTKVAFGINFTHWHRTIVGALENLIVADDRCPLERQAYVAALLLIESGVNPMLEVGRERDLWLFFLFGKHVSSW